ncbi:MAG TPA: VanZ family protein [Verrucomicrobiae bacterium]|nr:VanZ family protein [Verrucomicrobiae bacterium]
MWRFKPWLPVIVWMGVIFYASTDIGSTQHTSRIIRPLLRWFKPDISEEAIHDVQVCIRKSGHVSEYAVLAVLVWWARRKAFGGSGWTRKEIGVVLAICALYATSDEIHQIFVPSRGASPWDVLIDTGGASVGMLILWAVGRLRRRRS